MVIITLVVMDLQIQFDRFRCNGGGKQECKLLSDSRSPDVKLAVGGSGGGGSGQGGGNGGTAGTIRYQFQAS